MPTFTVKPVTAEWSVDVEIAKTTGTTVYLVTASEPTSPYAAIAATGVPSLGDVYPGSPTTGFFLLKCIKRGCRPVGQTRMVFKLECEYDNTVELSPNPLTEPTKISYGDETNEESYFKDRTTPTAKLAQTTAGEPFSELPKRQRSILVINYEKNVSASTNYSAYEGLRNKINSGTVTIDGRSYAAGTLLSSAPQLSEVKTRDAYTYRTLSGTIRANEDKWDQSFESRGLFEKVSGKLKPIADADGVPVEVPWPLNADGTKKAAASDTGEEIVLKPYTGADLSSLV
jgi:hypothetical protein